MKLYRALNRVKMWPTFISSDSDDKDVKRIHTECMDASVVVMPESTANSTQHIICTSILGADQVTSSTIYWANASDNVGITSKNPLDEGPAGCSDNKIIGDFNLSFLELTIAILFV